MLDEHHDHQYHHHHHDDDEGDDTPSLPQAASSSTTSPSTTHSVCSDTIVEQTPVLLLVDFDKDVDIENDDVEALLEGIGLRTVYVTPGTRVVAYYYMYVHDVHDDDQMHQMKVILQLLLQ